MTKVNRETQFTHIEAYTGEDLVPNDYEGAIRAVNLGLMNPETDAWLKHLYVREQFRGKKMGRRILNDFEVMCREEGRRRIVCVVSGEDGYQLVLENWLEKRGYTVYKTESDHFAFKDLFSGHE